MQKGLRVSVLSFQGALVCLIQVCVHEGGQHLLCLVYTDPHLDIKELVFLLHKTTRPPRDFMQSTDLLQDVLLLAYSKEQLDAFSSLLKTITADYTELRGIDDEPLGRY